MDWSKEAWRSLHPSYLIIPTYSQSTQEFVKRITGVYVYTVRQVIRVNVTFDIFT